MPTSRTIAIFDLGGVLVDWDPRYLYRKLFPGDETGMERFLSTICTPEWNEHQDAGRSFAEATALLAAEHPEQSALIAAWLDRFDETMAGPIQGAVDILAELRAKDVPLYALTNWSAETFPVAQRRFDFFDWFRGTVVSGVEKIVKPDPRLYRILLDRYRIDPAAAVYIDDRQANIDAADALGLHGLLFTTPETLRRDLQQAGLL